MVMGEKKGGWKWRRRGEKEGEENLREQDGRDGRKTEIERKERDILIEGAMMGLERNLALEEFPARMTSIKTLSNSGEDA